MSLLITARRSLVRTLMVCALAACDAADRLPSLPDSATTARTAPDGRRSAGLPNFSQLVETQGPTVVNVVTIRPEYANSIDIQGVEPGDPLYELFRRFVPDAPDAGPEAQQGLGSGFIISADGLILTNAHVIANSNSVLIRLSDGKREFPAKVLGADRTSDVALVKIDVDGLPVAQLGSSSSLRPGDWVAAIGSPFGFANSITAGIVSATNRELPVESAMPFIQTDVAVNPGNSGGPLINMAGQVIGINSMIYSGTGGYMGVSFAIPIEVALDVAKQLQEYGKVRRGRLGVAIQDLTPELAPAFHLEDSEGVLVGSIESGGPAERAGLRSGDVVLTYNGQPVKSAGELSRQIAASAPGSTAELSITRNGSRKQLSAKLGEVPVEDVTAPTAPTSSDKAQPASAFGLEVAELPPELIARLDIGYGLLIKRVDGPARGSPLRPGDLVVGVNAVKFSSLAQFNEMLARRKPGDTVAFLVRRAGATLYVPLQRVEPPVG